LNTGRVLISDSIFDGDDDYIKTETGEWKHVKIARLGDTRDHFTASYGNNSECRDIGPDPGFKQATHVLKARIQLAESAVGVTTLVTIDDETREPLESTTIWDPPELRYAAPDLTVKAVRKWQYKDVRVPQQSSDLTAAPN
jgi:hypothetical protein